MSAPDIVSDSSNVLTEDVAMKGMKEIRVFPRRTSHTPIDNLAFVGEPPIMLPSRKLPVSISVVWKWDIEEGIRLLRLWEKYFDDVKIGGPAFGNPGGVFETGRFVRPGFVFTSRGCDKCCPWCFGAKREKAIKELPVTSGWIIEDLNLLACSRKHIISVFDMLYLQQQDIIFTGFDARLFKSWHLKLLENIKVGEIFFACDSDFSYKFLEPVAEMLKDKPQSWRYCYSLIGYNEDYNICKNRIERIQKLGFVPVAMLYQGAKFIKYHKNNPLTSLHDEFNPETKYIQHLKTCVTEISYDSL